MWTNLFFTHVLSGVGFFVLTYAEPHDVDIGYSIQTLLQFEQVISKASRTQPKRQQGSHVIGKAAHRQNQSLLSSKGARAGGSTHELQPPGDEQRGNMAAEPKVRLFFHVFKGQDEALAISIVKEQMLTLQSAPPDSFEVDFITVGTLWDNASIHASGLGCSTCHHRAHYEQAFESVTLEFLYEYCNDNPTKHVAYMHNKGSFHDSGENSNVRRFLVKGIVSQECVDMPAECDVCSSRFSPLPHPHTPGNMWHAKCSHIRKLQQPSVFERIMDDFCKTHGSTSAWSQDWADGSGRYAAEHWVHSHPDTEPCDLYGGHYVAAYNLDEPAKDGTWLPQLQVGIRWPLEMYSHEHWPLTPTKMVEWARWRCLEWHTIYEKLPTDFNKWRFEEALLKMANVSLDAVGCSI